jgi:hypothetical protein
MSEGSTVKLVGKDGEREFEISKDAARLSKLIATTRKEQGDDAVIQLPNVSPDCLEKIVEFLNHYAEEPVAYMARMRFDGSNFRVVVGDEQQHPSNTWYFDFMASLDFSVSNEILTAARHLGIQSLLNLLSWSGNR